MSEVHKEIRELRSEIQLLRELVSTVTHAIAAISTEVRSISARVESIGVDIKSLVESQVAQREGRKPPRLSHESESSTLTGSEAYQVLSPQGAVNMTLEVHQGDECKKRKRDDDSAANLDNVDIDQSKRV